jgi:hypothetical protein
LALFRSLSAAPHCNKVSENDKTFGNDYKIRGTLKECAHTVPTLQGVIAPRVTGFRPRNDRLRLRTVLGLRPHSTRDTITFPTPVNGSATSWQRLGMIAIRVNSPPPLGWVPTSCIRVCSAMQPKQPPITAWRFSRRILQDVSLVGRGCFFGDFGVYYA